MLTTFSFNKPKTTQIKIKEETFLIKLSIVQKIIQQKENWKNFIKSCAGLFDDFFYQNYLKDCKVLDVDNGKIIISVPSTYTKRILLEKEIDKNFQNNGFIVVFVVNQNWNQTKKTQNQTTKNNFTFANLVVGKFNRGVVKISWKILAGESVWTPFFIYSEPGLGKTHILKAIENEANKLQKNCYYIHANTFGNLLFEAFKQGSSAIEKLKTSFDRYETILFDDVQLLAAREKTNEILFQIFCNVIDQKKQIVFTSDQHPEELTGFEKRLKSRFVNGLTLKIDFPDYETATEIAKKKVTMFVSKNVGKINPETLSFIGKHFYKDIRKIEGVIKKISFTLLENPNQEINLSEFQKLFTDQVDWLKNKTSPQTIQKQTAKLYGVARIAMVSGSRKSGVVKARSVAMYLVRCLTEESFANIAAQFGGKNHTTAVNAIKKIETKLKTSPELQKEVEYLKKTCQNE